jgi:D-alanine-D-alanine ligase
MNTTAAVAQGSSDPGSSRRVVALVFGGANTEHDVSVESVTSILASLDRDRFDVRLLFIDPSGRWHSVEGVDVSVGNDSGSRLPDLSGIDVVFPALHGRFGEDGTVQALCELAGVPYIGCGVLASALAMDKARASVVVHAAGVPVIPTVRVTSGTESVPLESLGAGALFVKPNRAGSSVGATLVNDRADLGAAIATALAEDSTALVQPAIVGAEVDVAVLRLPDGSLRVGPPLRIRHGASFFDYASKYDDGGASFEIPAMLRPGVEQKLTDYALRAFEALDGEGLARVDFFVIDDEVLFTEMNTMPGLTSHSQFPQIWAAEGLPFPELLTVLLETALLSAADATGAVG